LILTLENVVRGISTLPKNVWFDYINATTRSQVRLVSATLPEGPIRIERKSNGEVREATISRQMMARFINAVQENIPINIDRVLGASYNTRAAFEALLARTADFYWCVPGRIELIDGREEIRRGHKHLIWLPGEPHPLGVLAEHTTSSQMAISELPTQSVIYEALTLRDPSHSQESIEARRRHIQIQILLAMIGTSLGFRTWIASNDRNHEVLGKPISELPGVIRRLQDEQVLASYGDAVRNALLIDAIWFKNGRLMPAVIEVEQSTGTYSGLMRMKRFQESAPALADIRWVIAAPDEDRAEVMRKASDPQFASLDARYFPYSAIEELYSLCKRRGITSSAITEKFLDAFMEPCISTHDLSITHAGLATY
jgi:type II restriction enzyme